MGTVTVGTSPSVLTTPITVKLYHLIYTLQVWEFQLEPDWITRAVVVSLGLCMQIKVYGVSRSVAIVNEGLFCTYWSDLAWKSLPH